MQGRLCWLAIGLVMTVGVAACAPGSGPPSPAAGRADRLQQDLTAQALRGLAARSCPAAPVQTRLAMLPDISLRCLGVGPDRVVSAGDGRPTVVNLWASWCPPCVREMPMLQRTSERAGAAAAFVGIDTEDEPASAADLMDATGVRYPSYQDPQAQVRKALRAVGLPVTIVYDARGREVARRFGAIRGGWLDDALRQAGVVLRPAAG